MWMAKPSTKVGEKKGRKGRVLTSKRREEKSRSRERGGNGARPTRGSSRQRVGGGVKGGQRKKGKRCAAPKYVLDSGNRSGRKNLKEEGQKETVLED